MEWTHFRLRSLDGGIGSRGVLHPLGSKVGLSISLANQAELLSSTPGRRREARRLADEALAIATRHGYRQLIPEIQRIRDPIPSSEP